MPRQFHLASMIIRPIRYVQVEGIPIEDYQDFFHQNNHLSTDEVKIMCRHGNFPPGLILQYQNKVVKVVGDYGKHQILEPMRRR